MSNPGNIHLTERALARFRKEQLAPLAEAMATTVRDAIVEGMESAPARTGREYLIPGTKTPYVASAPGEPPAVREARYRDSWKVLPPVFSRKGLVSAAYSDLETDDGRYLIGAILEFGATWSAPRPHVAPAMPDARIKILRLLR